jgi:hypothetical protein
MDTWSIIILLFIAGCVGGLTNAAIAGELKLPHKDSEARVYRPGWIGNILVGGVAALVFWGLYGPMAAAVVIGPQDASTLEPILRVSELFAALLTGVGGGRLLTAAVDKQMSQKEIATLTRTRDKLATALTGLVDEVRP